jgi:hypothetical protein
VPFNLLMREDREDMHPRTKVLLAVAGLAALWVAAQTGVLEAVLALGLASPTVAGLALLAVIAYWALDELEDDDEARDVIDKTTSRAESASAGRLDGPAALVLGLVGIGLTVGTQALDFVAGLVDVIATAPLAAANLGTIAAGIGAMAGILASNHVVAIGAALLVLGLIARRRAMMGA